MVDSRIRELATSLAATAADVIVLAAPPGYEKLAIAAAYAAFVGPLYRCALPAHGEDAARAVLDALISGDEIRATRFAVDRLASRKGSASANVREALRREWPAAAVEDVFVLHDDRGTLATHAGAELIGELLATKPPGRRLIVSTRTALPYASAVHLPRDSTVVRERQDVRLKNAEIELLARRAGIRPADVHAMGAVANGWPLVTRLLIDQMRADRNGAVLDAVRTLPDEAVFAYVAHRSIAMLSDRVREALAVASFFDDADYLALVRILGPECDDAVFARLAALPFVARDGDHVTVHPEVARLVKARFAALVEPLYDRALKLLSRAGHHLAAARIALNAGDAMRAAQVVDAAPPFTSAPVAIGEYERVIERIDPSLVTRFPNLWIATIPYRWFSIDPSTYIREAETIYFCLPAGTDPDQSAAALMMLASAYANAGRAADVRTLLAEALSGFACADGSARASLLNFSASLRGIQGAFTEARALAAEAASMSRDAFGQNQTLHYIEAHEAAFRGRQGRLVVILDELMQRRAGTEPPLYIAYNAINGALFSWVNGDDIAFARYQTAFEDAITPAIESALAPLIDAARGRGDSEAKHPWPLFNAIVQLYRMANSATYDDALHAARAAAAAADLRGTPYTRILAHVAIYLLDENARPGEAALLERIVCDVESDELREAVHGVIRGGPTGMLEPFIRRRVRRQLVRPEPKVVVELLAGRVTVDGQDARLREKEFELMALLASTRVPLSRDQIGEALWEHLDSSEWSNNLKVTVYRVRKALGTRDVTITEGARHRLAPSIDVDLRRAEAVVRDRGATPEGAAAGRELRTVMESFGDGILERYERFAWSNTLVARLNDLACACGLAVASTALANGNLDDALTYAARVREIDHLNEGACEITIRALRARGATDAARREFQRYAEALRRELAAVPADSLAQLLVHAD